MLARTLLVWFVLLAVPFQGYAAAAMACAHGIGHAARVATPPCHQAAEKPDAHAPAGDKKCGNCAACSVGAAIAPALLETARDDCPRGPRPLGACARITVFDPDLPERPPRSNLA